MKRIALAGLLLSVALQCAAQATKTISLTKPPDQVFAAALRLVQSSSSYALLEKDAGAHKIRFRLNNYGMSVHERIPLGNAIFWLDQDNAGKTVAHIQVSIMLHPGTAPFTRASIAEKSEAKRFLKDLKRILAP